MSHQALPWSRKHSTLRLTLSFWTSACWHVLTCQGGPRDWQTGWRSRGRAQGQPAQVGIASQHGHTLKPGQD